METSNILGSPTVSWESAYTQQGDLILVKCGTHGIFETEYESIPSDAKESPGSLLFKGTSNSHALFGGVFQIYEKDHVKFVRVMEPAVLDHVKDVQSKEHAEHHAQWIPVGEYFVGAVIEYDHLKEESRRIVD